jgi:hypothetical protein
MRLSETEALSGINILDSCRVVSGPFATMTGPEATMTGLEQIVVDSMWVIS